MKRALLATVACVAWMGGCEPRTGAADEFVVRDSAGVRITIAPSLAGLSTWRVAPAANLELGAGSAPSEAPFADIAGVLQLPDGRLVVADKGAHALRFYDAAGKHLRSVGRQGGGPGEFEQIAGLWRFRGDSIAVWDLRQGRLSIFTAEGEFARGVHPRPALPGSYAPMHGVFADGSFLLGSGMNLPAVFARGSGRLRDTVTLVRYTSTGEAIDTVGRFPGDERDAAVAATGFSLTPVPFGKRTYVAAAGTRAYVTTGDDHGVTVIEGAARHIHRQRVEPDRVRAEDVAAYREGELANAAAGDRAAVETRLQNARYPEFKAPFAALRVDGEQNIWLRKLDVPGYARATEWIVLSPDGRPRARVALPPRFILHQVLPDAVVGVELGPLDEPYIRRFPLSR